MTKTSSPTNSELNSKSAWFVWIMAAMFYFYQYTIKMMTSVFVDDMMATFQINAAQIGLLNSMFYFGYVAMLLPIGILLDKFGPKRVLSLAGFVCAIGCYLFVATNNLSIASFGRLLMGVGASAGFVGSLVTASLWFSPKNFALLNGLTISVGTLGVICATPTIAYCNNALAISWDKIVLFLAAMGCVMSFCIMLFSKQHPSIKSRGALKASARNEVSILTAFKQIATNVQFWVVSLFGLFLYVVMASYAELWSLQFIQVKYGIGETKASLINLLFFLGVTIGGPIGAKFSDMLRSRIMIFRIYCTLLITVILAIIYIDSLGMTTMCALMFLTGFFFSAKTLNFTCVREIMPSHLVGKAISFCNVLVMMSGVIFQGLIGKFIQSQWQGKYVEKSIAGVIQKIPYYSINDYKYAFIAFPICILIAFSLTFVMKETYNHK